MKMPLTWLVKKGEAVRIVRRKKGGEQKARLSRNSGDTHLGGEVKASVEMRDWLMGKSEKKGDQEPK